MKTLHRYCISLKKTKSAESISPIPRLKISIHKMGNKSERKRGVNATPSIAQKTRNTIKVSPKLIRDEVIFENKNRYFGTLTFVNMLALPIRAPIP